MGTPLLQTGHILQTASSTTAASTPSSLEPLAAGTAAPAHAVRAPNHPLKTPPAQAVRSFVLHQTHRRCDSRPAAAASCACRLAGWSCSRTGPSAALIPEAQVHQRGARRGLPGPHREAEDLHTDMWPLRERGLAEGVVKNASRLTAVLHSRKHITLPLPSFKSTV